MRSTLTAKADDDATLRPGFQAHVDRGRERHWDRHRCGGSEQKCAAACCSCRGEGRLGARTALTAVGPRRELFAIVAQNVVRLPEPLPDANDCRTDMIWVIAPLSRGDSRSRCERP